MGKKRIHAIIHGRVQGVFFRDYTQREATRLALSGWVRNLPDRTVETEFEGDAKEVDAMLAWLRTGSPLSEVTDIVQETIPPQGTEKTFIVRY